MAKKRRETTRREPTRRELSRWQQEKKRRRLIQGLGMLVIVAAVLIVGVGWYLSQFRPLHETAIRVNGTEFSMDYYVKALEFYSAGRSTQSVQFLADQTEVNIQQNELVRQGALQLGFSVSDTEIRKELDKLSLPFNEALRDIFGAQILVRKLRDEYFDKQVPESAGQRHLFAMLLESERQANEVKARLESGEDFAKLAAELSLDDFTKTKKGDLGWHPKDVLTELLGTSIPGEYAFSAERGVVSQPLYDEKQTKQVGYWLIEVLEKKKEPEEAHIQAILLGSEEQAEKIRGRLEAGGDFGEVAKEVSQHAASKKDGGDLDWIIPGTMSPLIDEFVFGSKTEPGTLSQPIRDDTVLTKGGYWLVELVDIDADKAVVGEDRDLLKNKLLNEWLVALGADPDNEIKSFIDDPKRQWAILRVIGG